VIFLHGLGSTGDAWVDSLSEITESHVKIITPTAPKIQVTVKNCEILTAWFDIKSNESSAEEDEYGIKQSRDFVIKIIENEIAGGIHPSRIILGGFSQGGAQALYTGLTSQYKLGGVFALSTWLPLHKTFPAAAANNLDIHIFQV
jgi:lysophospholipase-2